MSFFCKIFIDINIIGAAKIAESILLLCTYPGETKYIYDAIYKDYQNGNIKLKIILVVIFGFQNICVVDGNWF